MLACAAAALLATAFSLAWIRPHTSRVPVRTALRSARDNLRAAAALGLGMSLAAIYYRIDQSLVLRIAGATAAAEFGVAARILLQVRVVPSSLQMSISALLARQLQGGGELLAADRDALRRIALAGGLGLSAATIALGDLAVLVVGGPTYEDAAVYVVALGVAVAAVGFVYVVVTSAIMSGLDRLYLACVAAAACFNVALNVVLLSVWGAIGACVALALTEILVVLILSRGLTARRGGARPADLGAVVAIGALAAGAKLVAMDASWIANAAVSAALLALAAVLLKGAYARLRALA